MTLEELEENRAPVVMKGATLTVDASDSGLEGVSRTVASRHVRGILAGFIFAACTAAMAADVRETFTFKGPFDMHTARGVTFTFKCDIPSRVFRSFVYFRSGQGCYMVPFEVPSNGCAKVSVDRNDCIREEKSVAGWRNVSSVLVSFWRDEGKPVSWSVSDLALRNEPYDAVVCTAGQCVHDFPKRLERCGLRALLVSASELDDGILASAKLFAPIGGKQPYPASANAAIARFKARGGKVITIGERLNATTRTKLMALLESRLPELDTTAFKAARTAHLEAMKITAAAAAEFPAFMRAGGDEELRVIGCHTAYGPEFIENMSEWEDWDANCRRLKAVGFNALSVNVARGGIAFYDSKVLPVSPDVAKKGDAVEQIKAACAKHGMKFIAWKVCFRSRAGMQTPEFRKWLEDGRRAVSFAGKESDDWLCPVHPDNRKLEVEALVELAKRRPWAISLDYIRFHGTDWCVCDSCRAAFEKRIGRKVENWPKAIMRGQPMNAKFEEFRRDSITTLVREVARRVRAEAPGVKIRASVYRHPHGNAIAVAQDWESWCREGLLDIVGPMNGSVSSSTQLKEVLAEQIAAAGKVPVASTYYPSLWNQDKNARDLMDFIKTGREAGTQGFGVFRFDGRLVEMLGIKK